MPEIEIDGSFGEGGGQILRTALSLSLLTGKGFRIYNLRAKRAKSGLRAQHLSAVKSAVKISGSKVSGDEIGSKEIIFSPERAKPGRYKIDIGTAGSTALVFQTLLPVLLCLDQESELTLKGGTHNPKSPCFDFLKECFLPLLSQLGIKVEAKLLSYGFYPKGGGEVHFKIYPWKREGKYLQLSEPADWEGPSAEILLANLAGHIAERERAELVKRLGISPERVQFNFLSSEFGPGNVILLRYFNKERSEIFTGYGERGKRAERVAQEVVREAKNFCKSKSQVDHYLSDQLLIYLALSQGEFTTNFLSSHFHTNLEMIEKFLKIDKQIWSLRSDLYLVRINQK